MTMVIQRLVLKELFVPTSKMVTIFVTSLLITKIMSLKVIEGQTVYHRQCDTDPGQQCLIDQELNSVHCFCNTDNCNADQQCNCEVEENRVCQVCAGAEGACQDQNDNGEAQTCAQGQVCGYFLEGN